MALTPEQVKAMATEIVQHIKGEAQRHREEEEAKAKNKGDTDAKREQRLVAEVAAKLTQALGEAVEPAEEGKGEASSTHAASKK